jgi:hypothetical protein
VRTLSYVTNFFATRVNAGACLAALGLILIPVAAPLAAEKAASGSTETFRAKDRFQLSATVQDKAGRTRTIRVSARQWDILGNQRALQFPEHGFLLVELLGGRVTTVIGGKEQKRHHGEFWTVPAGTPMSVTAVGEDATLNVVSFSGL